MDSEASTFQNPEESPTIIPIKNKKAKTLFRDNIIEAAHVKGTLSRRREKLLRWQLKRRILLYTHCFREPPAEIYMLCNKRSRWYLRPNCNLPPVASDISSDIEKKKVSRKAVARPSTFRTFSVETSCNDRKWDWRRSFFFFLFLPKTVEGNSRKTANHYGVHYANSYAYSNGAPSVYTSTGCCTSGGYNVQQPQLHEDYRPIYFYVAQPYTIPYTFAKRPKPAASSSSLLRATRPRGSNCRVKFSKRLSNADFSQKVKQGEFSRSLNQVHFAESQGQGYYIFQFT